jgi:antitoxin YefM
MRTISYTAARAHLAETMQQVCDDHATVVVTRSKAEPIVMMSLSDYEEIAETIYLMSSPTNMVRLQNSMDEIERLIEQDKKDSK